MSKTILVLGDSITHGSLDVEKGGWAERLKQWLWEHWDEYDASLYNLGIDGDTVQVVNERFEKELHDRITRFEDEPIVCFAIGINNSLTWADGRVMTEEDDFRNEFAALLDKAQAKAKQVIVVGLTSIDETKTSPVAESATGKCYTSERVGRFDEIIRAVCAEKNTLYLSMDGVLEPEDLPDGLHPNAHGHQKMFERVRDFLLQSRILG